MNAARPGRAEMVKPGVNLIQESYPNEALDIFTRVVDGGVQGLFITREHPRSFVGKNFKAPVRFAWLPRTDGQTAKGEEAVAAIGERIASFARECEGGVVVLDGVECLLKMGGPGSVGQMLARASRAAAENGVSVLVPLAGERITERDVAELRAQMGDRASSLQKSCLAARA